MKYVVMLTYEEALALGIVHCYCGHPPNNHFMDQDGKPCAHCHKDNCPGYRERFSKGKAIG